MILNCGVVWAHFICNYLYFVLITLKMTKKVTETCRDYYLIKLR